MSSERDIESLGHIIENIERIERHTAGLDRQQFEADQLRVDAVERCLSRLSEASTRLGDRAEKLAPSIPWHNVRGFGNYLRHGYDVLNQDVTWNIVQRDLPDLKAASLQARSVLQRGQEERDRDNGRGR